ncbi:hypothetical protein DSECCO2_445430 [anaerobic digester metagenome]
MRITIQNPVNERRESLWFPWKAEDFEKACLGLEILPSTEPNCTIVEVSDERLSTLLKDKPCNIDELDYLMKRLDSFDRDELQTFYAMAYQEKAETTTDLINITFNTHCYSVVADFSDLDAVGKKMYLTEQGAVREKELQEFDGRRYFEELLAGNPNSRITPYGILYQNKNPIQTIYDGLHFPLYHWQALLDSMYEFELFPNIHTAEEYGKYIICESGHFEYDQNIKEYIDYERYGKQKIASENGAFTERGYVLYQGYNEELAQVFWEYLGIEIPKQDFQELKLYMPLRGTTYYDENDYGDLYQVDYKIDVCPDELAEYKDEILQAIERNGLPEETQRGLMRYYCDQDSVNAKVKRYDFSVEEVNDQLMGVANLILNVPLDDRELARIKDEITG